jgi:choloylglycine hydrolase
MTQRICRLPLVILVGVLATFVIDVTRLGACTTFCLKAGAEIVFGRNYDYTFDDALVLVNKRGVTKESVVNDSKYPAAWTSAYGSVTFNQYGRENPTGGMNEAGLVVEELWLDATQYVSDAHLPTLGTQEWIQYELDTAGTVSEAIEHAHAVRIDDNVKVHYMITDHTGATAAVEFLGGRLIVHTGRTLPVPVLTNDTYDDSVAESAGTLPAQATTESSLHRFIRAGHRVASFVNARPTEAEIVYYAFETLADAAQHSGTQWTIVYDPVRRKIHFRTRNRPLLKVIEAAQLDYACSAAVMMLDIDTAKNGDVTNEFAKYTRSANRDLIERAFNKTPFLKDTPASIRNLAAAFPEEFSCASGGRLGNGPAKIQDR